MTTLLERLTSQRKLVADLREPERVLADLEAAYAEEQAERAQKQARLDQAQAELSDHERTLARLEPREGKYHAAVEVLDALGDDAMRGLSLSINPHTMSLAAIQCRGELELLANARAAHKRLQSEIRTLKHELGVKR